MWHLKWTQGDPSTQGIANFFSCLTFSCVHRSFLTKFAVKDIPTEAVTISREMYEERELFSPNHEEEASDSDYDEFEAEKDNATAAVQRITRY